MGFKGSSDGLHGLSEGGGFIITDEGEVVVEVIQTLLSDFDTSLRVSFSAGTRVVDDVLIVVESPVSSFVDLFEFFVINSFNGSSESSFVHFSGSTFSSLFVGDWEFNTIRFDDSWVSLLASSDSLAHHVGEHDWGSRNIAEDKVPSNDAFILEDWEVLPDLEKFSSDTSWVKNGKEVVTHPEEWERNLFHVQVQGIKEVSRDFNEGPAADHQKERPVILGDLGTGSDSPDQKQTATNLQEGGKKWGWHQAEG